MQALPSAWPTSAWRPDPPPGLLHRSPVDRRLVWLGLGLVLLGVLCRGLRLIFPIWGDEASVALNLVERGYAGLRWELAYRQMAPLLFLWVEKAVYEWAGPSALCLRLLPLLAGVAGLVLFWGLARRCLPVAAATLAAGFLAVSRSPIELSANVKPYALDLFFSVVLLWLAVAYLRRPGRTALLAGLALLIPFAVGCSYPVVFVAGAVSLVLLPVVWRQGPPAARAWFVAFNLLLVGTFVAHLLLVGREEYAGARGEDLAAYMKGFWRYGFPHGGPFLVLGWFVHVHVGSTFSNPVEFNGGGLVGLVLCLLGAFHLRRQGQGSLVLLCVLPYALHLLAAILHRYPYGAHARLQQHLLPCFCLLAGTGLAYLVEYLAAAVGGRLRWLTAVAAGLFLVGVCGAVADVRRPYHDDGAHQAARVVRHIRGALRPGDQVVVRQSEARCGLCLRWQLLALGDRVHYAGPAEPGTGAAAGSRVWVIDDLMVQGPADAPEPAARQPGKPASHRRYVAAFPATDGTVARYCCDVYLCEPASAAAKRH
jgi:hypothetical protein